MKNLLLILFAVGIALLVSPFANAQDAETIHIFPQIADGQVGDGTYFTSVLMVTNLSGLDTSCSFTPLGLASRFRFPNDFSLRNGFTYTNPTQAIGPLVSGTASLNCGQPVHASLMYTFVGANGHAIGAATVFSAPPMHYARFNSFAGVRAGVAIPNVFSSTLTISVKYVDQSGNVIGKIVDIPAGSHYVHFVDEILGTSLGYGLIEITSNQTFWLTALQFDGPVFTTVVPAWNF